MRRSGKTTRLIDRAVQELFNEDKLTIALIEDYDKRGEEVGQIIYRSKLPTQ